MPSWQIKALELEASALKRLDGFVHTHALYFLIGVICFLLALLGWVLSGGLRRKGGQPMCHIRPTIVIHLSGPPPSQEPTFDAFPPMREYDCDHDYDDYPLD